MIAAIALAAFVQMPPASWAPRPEQMDAARERYLPLNVVQAICRDAPLPPVVRAYNGRVAKKVVRPGLLQA